MKQNKGAAGVDKVSIDEAEQYIRQHKAELIQVIRQRKYQLQPVRRVEVPKTIGGVRLLGIPIVMDRIIHQAIAQIITPLLDKTFHESGYG